MIPSDSGANASRAGSVPPKGASGPLSSGALPKADASSRLLLVLGMHRSGTSALAGAMSALGLVLGEGLLEPAEDNPKGFFENAEIVSIQQRLLESLGRDWHDPTRLPDGWLESKVASAAAAELKAELSRMLEQGATLLVKDPRASLLVPLWSTITSDLGCALKIAIMVRSPFEVIASLSRRDGMSFRRAALLWLRYMLQVEFETRGMPRVFLSHRSLLADWRAEVRRISNQLDLDLQPNDAQCEAVDQFLDVTLHRNRDPERPSGHPELLRLLADAERALLAMCGAESPTLTREFDMLRARLEEMAEDHLEVIRLDRSYHDQVVQAAVLESFWRPTVPKREIAASKMYWRKRDETYAEERAQGVLLTPKDDGFVASFLVPLGQEPEFIRFDPDDQPGIFGILEILVNGVKVAQRELLTSVSEFELPSSSPEQVRVGSLNDDPYIELELLKASLGPVAGGTIQVRFYRESLARYFEGQVGGLRQQLKQTECTLDLRVAALEEHLHERLSEASSHIASLGDALTVAHQRIVELQLQMQVLLEQQAGELASALSAINAEQRVLKNWAERRSFSYWWRRLRRLR